MLCITHFSPISARGAITYLQSLAQFPSKNRADAYCSAFITQEGQRTYERGIQVIRLGLYTIYFNDVFDQQGLIFKSLEEVNFITRTPPAANGYKSAFFYQVLQITRCCRF